MRSKLRARTPIIALAFICIAVLFIASCSTNEVEIPGLTGPSGARLFITIEASPDSVFIRKPSNAPGTSRITLQLKNQLGEGVPNARIKVRITNADGSEVAIGSLDHLTVLTDSAGFARLTYTAPSTAEQPVPVQIFLLAILTDPAYAFEVVSTLRLDLELARPFDCVDGPGGPTVSFEVTGALVEDEEVCFDAQGTTDNGAIISFTWNFGDGKTSSGSFACHVFTSQGQFPVTLTVIDGDQNCVSLTQIITIGEGGSPTCTFTTSPNPVNTDTTVFFDASASTDSDGNIVSFTWNFGDGTTRSGEQVTHSFSVEGSFTVSLAVRDNAGNETVCTQVVTVASGLPECPTIDIDPDPANVGEEVTFTITNPDVDPDGGTVTFAWDLDNDGSFDDGTGNIVTFTYTTEGAKIIRVRATDDEENSVICLDSLTVGNPLPTCTFNFAPAAPNANDVVTFDATASTDPDGGTLTFLWDFDDDGQFDDGSGAVDTFIFTTDGTFLVTLQVTDDEGNVVTCSRSVTVGDQPVPVCTFTAAPNPSCVDQNVTFDASASDPNDTLITSFEWDFNCPIPGNSVDSTAGPIAINAFATAGTFNVCLEVTNNDGVSISCNRPQVVNDSPVLDASPDEFAPDSGEVGDSVQIFGSRFASAANGGSVRFNTTNQPAFSVNGAGTVITTTVPNGATDGPITVSNNCGSDVSVDDFDVIETVSINTTPVAQAEGTGAGTTPFTFTVTQSAISDQVTSVDFTTTPGGGTPPVAATEGTCGVAGEDYQDNTGTLNIPAGSLSATITVTVCRDADIEQDEGFTVTLTNPVNAVITNGTAFGVIQNDD